MSGASDLWNVALRGGEIRAMSLDELDAAFEAGTVSASTMVLPPDSTEWVRLGTIAGLNDSAQEEPIAQAAPASPFPPALSIAPPASMPPPSAHAPNSYAPVAFDATPMPAPIDLDFDLAPPKKSKKVAYVIGGLAAFGLLIAVATSGGDDAPAPTAAAQQAPAEAKPYVPNIDPLAAPKPQPAATTPAQNTNTLSDEQKKALADLDKANDAKHRAKVSAAAAMRGGGVRNSSSYKSDDPFTHGGGNAHDPLNGKL